MVDAKPTLARVDALGLSDRDVERGAELPAGFLAKSRKGRNLDHRAASSWKRLRAWLDAREAPPAPAPEPFPNPRPPAPPTKIEQTPPPIEQRSGAIEQRSSKAPEDRAKPPAGSLESAIKAARTQRALGALLSRVAAEVAAGGYQDELRRVEILESLISRRSKLLKEERAERAARQVRALEILSADEVQVLEAYRAWLAGPALGEGEAAPPPLLRETPPTAT